MAARLPLLVLLHLLLAGIAGCDIVLAFLPGPAANADSQTDTADAATDAGDAVVANGLTELDWDKANWDDSKWQ